MKNYLLVFIVIFFMTNDTFGQVISGGSIQVTYSIGRRSLDCKRFSICKAEKVIIKLDSAPLVGSQNGPNRDFYAKTSIDNSGKLRIEVDQKNMDLIQFYEGAKKILIEESFIIDNANISKELNIEPYTVGTGEYVFILDDKTSTYVLYF